MAYSYSPPFSAVGAHVRNAVLTSAVVITTPAAVSGVLIQSLVANVRYTLDNTTPTATIGFQLKAGDPAVFLAVNAGQVIRMIQEAANAEVQYQFGAY